MTTYYDILKVSPEATAAEIEAAYEAQYNHWRRLVTHHDPNVVNKSNQTLQWLEKIRATLTDPAKREQYDAGIGLRGPVGGLADPTTASQARPMTPPPPKPRVETPPTPVSGVRVDAWLCPQCQTASPVGTQFCKKCGNTLGKNCPKCGKLIEATAEFCSECGVNIAEYEARQRWLAEAQRRREQEEARLRAEEVRRAAEYEAKRQAQEREKMQRQRRVIGIVLALVAVVIVACIAASSIADAIERQRQYARATATAAQRYANVTATADALIAASRIVDAHGVSMVYVPAGEFLMGSTDAAECASSDEKPQHRVYLDAFWIDQTEVTNAQYRQCVQAGVCEASVYANDSDLNGDMQPVVGVDWDNAQTYCVWAGKRLPTEAQWEKAARGTDGRIYPWGSQLATCEYAVMDDGRNGCGKGDKAWPVGSKPQGASPHGALDMAGNVWEWVADWYDEDYYVTSPNNNPAGPGSGFTARRVLRGGSWSVNWNVVRAANRFYSVPSGVDDDVGFRCVRSGSGY